MTDITYQNEDWKNVGDEIKTLVAPHFKECDITDGKFPLDLDMESLGQMNEAGLLRTYTARDGDIVGYVVNIIMPRHNTFKAKYACQIGWYVKEDYRHSNIGLKLLTGAEEDLKGLGVQASFASHPMQTDLSRVFERHGFKKAEINYFKYIGE